MGQRSVIGSAARGTERNGSGRAAGWDPIKHQHSNTGGREISQKVCVVKRRSPLKQPEAPPKPKLVEEFWLWENIQQLLTQTDNRLRQWRSRYSNRQWNKSSVGSVGRLVQFPPCTKTADRELL